MLRRIIYAFPVSLGLVLVSLSGLPAAAQPELSFKVPASSFSLEKRSQGKLTPIPGGSVWIQAITRDPLFVVATFPPGAGRFEVTHVIVHFHSDKRTGGSLASVQLHDSQSGDVLNATTGDSGKFVRSVSGPSTYTQQIPPRTPPKTIGAGAFIRLGVDSALGFEGGLGEAFDLVAVEVFYKNAAFKLPPASTSVNPNSPGPVRATVPPTAPSIPSAPPAPPTPSIPNVPHSKAVIYIINDAHELLWYRHDGRADGSFQWAAKEGSRVGIGWNFRTVIGTGDGVMYAINREGDLIWYRHDGAGERLVHLGSSSRRDGKLRVPWHAGDCGRARRAVRPE
jgi:hypothetical protein